MILNHRTYWLAGWACLLYGGWGAQVGAQDIQCQLRQVTDGVAGTFSGSARIADDVPQITLGSSASLVEGGTSEIFIVETEQLGALQVTNNSDYDGNATVSADGQWIAYESEADDTGGNADHNREIMLYSVQTGQRLQVTDSSGQNNFTDQISRDGSRIVFRSRADLTGGNPLQVNQAFLYTRDTQTLTQLTSVTEFSAFYNSDRDVRRLVISASEDLTGGNPELNQEVFVLDLESMILTQVTATVEGSTSGLAISDNGRFIVLNTDAEEFVGPDPVSSSFLVLDRLNDSIEFLSDDFITSGRVALSADGRRAAVTVNGGIRLYDLALDQVVELAPANGFIQEAESISSDGLRISLRASSDLTGDNPDFSFEIYLADCTNPAVVFGDGFEVGSTASWSQSMP